MIMLPSPHRAYIKAFWVILSLGVSGLLAGTIWTFGNLWGLFAGIGIGILFLVYGLLEINMKVMWVSYRAWNKLAGWVSSVLQSAIEAVSFFIVFLFVGRLGSSLRLDMPKPHQSLWATRGTMPVHAYESQSSFSSSSKKNLSWGSLLVSWATKSGNYWVWFLLPYFYILSLLDTESSEEVPSGIYTLY